MVEAAASASAAAPGRRRSAVGDGPYTPHAMHIGIMGLGYVGLPLAVAFAEEGHTVIGLDTDARKIEALRERRSYIEDIPSDRLAPVADRIEATRHAQPLARCDAVLICVPTPLTANREPDLGPLVSATRSLAGVLQSGQLVIVESTTYPGTTRETIAPMLEESGLVAGQDFHLAFLPERVDPGRTDVPLRTTPTIVGGLTDACGDRAQELYETVCDHIVRVSTPDAAELAKLLENIFRSVNIALVNEMAMIADRMDIDIWEVVDAAATKPYGFMRFDPGPGMGGHCLPVDPFYLTWKAREYDMSTEFIELAGKVNQAMPYFCMEKVERALNDAEKAVRGSKVLVVGVAYKGGTSDMRESPALKIVDLLVERGAEVAYHDDFVREIGGGLQSVPLDEGLDGADIAVI